MCTQNGFVITFTLGKKNKWIYSIVGDELMNRKKKKNSKYIGFGGKMKDEREMMQKEEAVVL